MAGKANKADPDTLPQRQRAFADEVMSGNTRTLAAAYRLVYDTSGTTKEQKKAEGNEASRLWRHPGIVAHVDCARSQIEVQRARRAVGEREAIRAKLWREAEGERAGDRLVALKMLGQEAGMFTDRIELSDANTEMSDAEVIAEIEAALAEVQSAGDAVPKLATNVGE